MEGGRIIQTGPPEAIVTRPATDYVRDFVANVNPLSVLTLSSVLTPAAGLEPDGARGERVWIDRRTRLYAEVTDHDGLHRVVGDGLSLRLIRDLDREEAVPLPYDTVLLAPPEAPVRLAVEAIRVTGWPVCVVDSDGQLLGRVGIDEILGCLGWPPRLATDPTAYRSPKIHWRCPGNRLERADHVATELPVRERTMPHAGLAIADRSGSP